MRITIEVEPVLETCQYGQEDGSTTYYAFRVVGLPSKYSSGDVVMRCCQALYPGNEAVREFVNASGK